MEIRLINSEEIQIALNLAYQVFLKFEAPEYTQEGINEFKNSIYSQDFINKQTFFGAFIDDNMVGMIATRNNRSHISMFFVDEKAQGKGVGRKLFNKVINGNINHIITVNSSPYALDIYKHFGFIVIDEERCENGIKYIPMELKLKKDKIKIEQKKKQKLLADKQKYFDYYDDVKVSSHKIYDW